MHAESTCVEGVVTEFAYRASLGDMFCRRG
jgi:hypothetical protein